MLAGPESATTSRSSHGEIILDRPEPSPEDASFPRTLGDLDPSFASLLRQVVADWQQAPGVSLQDTGPSTDPRPVERIGRFEVIGVLGHGGYGTVLRVRDLKLGCERAMKVPNPDTLASPRSLARFMDEARKAVIIDHPNVVRVLEADEVFALYYMVMEYCPEGSLAGWLTRRPPDRPIPPRWAAALVAEIADGVQQAHAAGLLHRDLKPGNVMLVRVGDPDDADPPAFRPKVGDFGLAKAMGESPGRLECTASGAMVGTLAYMSPEQARGEKTIREGTDVHGLGAILFELLTRSVPYPGSSEAEVLARILGDGPPPSPRSLCPVIPRDLDTICRTALARKPEDRYATAAQLADDLRRFLRNDSVKGSPWWKRARAGLRRHRSCAALAGLAVLLAAAVVAGLPDEDRKDASIWLTRLRAAHISEIPDLIAERPQPGRRLIDPLGRLFVGDDPSTKLAAALALASTRSDCAEHAYDRLLEARPDEIRPIARCLGGRMEGLLQRLEQDIRKVEPSGGPPLTADAAEVRDRRRANAAAALVALGRHDAGLDLLRFDPDPQARSFLIHDLGPAGVAPRVLYDRLIDSGTETSIRRALILALGEIPPSAWDVAERQVVTATVLDLFRNDPDSGIHGAARWLLASSDRRGDIARIEAELANDGTPRAGFRWRVSRCGLTFVTIDDPDTGRVIEISDTEVRATSSSGSSRSTNTAPTRAPRRIARSSASILFSRRSSAAG